MADGHYISFVGSNQKEKIDPKSWNSWPEEIRVLIEDSVLEKPKENPYYAYGGKLQPDADPELLSNIITKDIVEIGRPLSRVDLTSRPSLNFRAGRVKDSIKFWDHLAQFHKNDLFEETYKIASGCFQWVRLKILLLKCFDC